MSDMRIRVVDLDGGLLVRLRINSVDISANTYKYCMLQCRSIPKDGTNIFCLIDNRILKGHDLPMKF